MSKDEREEDSKGREDGCVRKRKIRSPCLDSHYEAYILRSRWTVGNLYASNLYLGQVHLKYVQDIDRQLKTWLHFKERDQQKLEKRLFELEALKKPSFKSVRFIDQELATKDVNHGLDKKVSRDIGFESAKPKPFPCRQFSRVQAARLLPDVFPPQSSPKARDINPHPLRLLLPNNTDKKRSGQKRRKTGQFCQMGSAAPMTRDVLSGKFSSLSLRWKSRRTSLSANPRLTSLHEKGGKKLVPKWVPLAFRL